MQLLAPQLIESKRRSEDGVPRLAPTARRPASRLSPGAAPSPARTPLPRSAAHVRLHRGRYLPTPVWERLSDEDRHLCRVLSAHAAASVPPVFSHVSAAIMLGMPIYGPIDERVHLTNDVEGAGVATPGVVRHRSRLGADDIVSVGELRCTSPERTILDLARSSPAEVALAATDGYLREHFRVGRRVDPFLFAEWQGEMADRLAALRGAFGVRAARKVLELADPRTDSVLESVSHLQLDRLGFEVELQVEVPGPSGRSYFVDFELLGLELFGECDGKAKYTDERLRAGRSAEELVYRDKRRQDWICGSTRKKMIRWGSPDVVTPSVFARRLRAFGVPIPRLVS